MAMAVGATTGSQERDSKIESGTRRGRGIMEELTLEKIHCYILVGRANNRLNIEETLTAEGLQNLLTLNWDAVNPIKETGK